MKCQIMRKSIWQGGASGLDKQEIERILQKSILPLENMPDYMEIVPVRCRVGQIISDCPWGIPSVGVIASGRVDVYSVAIDGRDVQLNSLEAGECFGICNLMVPNELETVLRCAQDGEILYIAKNAILKAMEENPSVLRQYMTLYNKKIQFLLGRIELLTMQSCRGKLLAFLLAQQDNGGCVRMNGSREDLACMLGISRAALFRELAMLQTQGLIQAKGTMLKLLDVPRLEAILYQPVGN